MARLRQRLALLLSLAGLAGVGLAPSQAIAGTTEAVKGAKIYCYMRSSNNDHQVSWEAAYALIKRQKGGIFKTARQRNEHFHTAVVK